MIKITGSGIVPEIDQRLFPGATIFLASEALVDELKSAELRERISMAAGGGRAVIWVDTGTPPRLTVMELDERGCIARPVTLPGGMRIDAGTIAMEDFSKRGAVPGPNELWLGLDGREAGVLSFFTAEPVDPWIRFFFPAKTQPIDGFRFRMFETPSAGEPMLVRIDPNRPFDPGVTVATPKAGTSIRTNFRTPWGGVVVLTTGPDSHYVNAFDPARKESYSTASGFWNWTVEGRSASEIDLLPGHSGAEYVKAPASWVAHFVAGAPAFAPRFHPEAQPDAQSGAGDFPLTSQIPGVQEPVTTAWFYVKPAAAGVNSAHAGYYSQPDRAPLFVQEPSGALLRALSLEAVPLPPNATTPYAPAASFPIAPYAGLEIPADASSSALLDHLRQFETEVLAAARTTVIYNLKADGPRGLGRDGVRPVLGLTGGPTGPTGPIEIAVTPQGLVSIFSPAYDLWEEFVVAQAEHGGQRLCYTGIQGKMREALLANQLFLVVSDPAKLYQHCSTTYCVTADVIQTLKLMKPPAAVLHAVAEIHGNVYQTVSYFDSALKKILGTNYTDWGPVLLKYAELAQITIAGWTFDLASWLWDKGDDSTILVIKFTDGDFESSIDDLTRWILPGEFNAGGGEAAQARLRKIVANAKLRVGAEPELQYFVDTVLAERPQAWNGVLYLNAAVPANAFPPEVAALAAGLPPGPLRAHHLGVTLSSFVVTKSGLGMSDSSLFGLILYEDPADLVFNGSPYDFKVLSLRIRFANSTVASFTSQVELLVAQLFGETATLIDGQHGNNILLDGTLQKGSYRFTTPKGNQFKFRMTSHVLAGVAISSAQFTSLPSESTAERTVASFLLNGSMTFQLLGDFDLFGFGPDPIAPFEDGQLAFTNLTVSMDFNPNDRQLARTFGFVAGQMNLDPSGSHARAGSLPRRFPLQAAAMRQGEPKTDGKSKPAMPASFGFIPVESPLVPGDLGPVWFGLEMTLSFGSPGALAPNLSLTGSLLAAWAPSADRYNVAVGIRLPGSTEGEKSLTIMGPLKLGLGRLNFLYDKDTKGYLLRLENIALSFLGLRFPPGGKTNALLFGDPDPKASNNALGWYAAYKKDEEKKPKPTAI